MNLPTDLKYTKEHEWVRRGDDGMLVIGVTDYAQGELGDVVYLDIDTVGASLKANEVFGTIEAVKTVSDLYMPVSGSVEEVNSQLDGNPEIVNSDPYGEGWLVKVKPDKTEDVDGLMDAGEYEKLIQG